MSFAQQLGENISGLPSNPKVQVDDLRDFDHEQLSKVPGPVVFVVSCFGKGEATDGAKPFYSWLNDAARSSVGSSTKPLAGLPFAVFGCGSSKVVFILTLNVPTILPAMLGCTRLVISDAYGVL